MKGDGRNPEYPSVGVDDDVGALVVLVRDRVERPAGRQFNLKLFSFIKSTLLCRIDSIPDVTLPHPIGGDVDALHAAVLRLVPSQPAVAPSLKREQ